MVAVLVVAALALAAFNLRPALSSVSPELNEIRSDLGLSGFAAGAMTTLPILCMGAFATLAASLARRFGLERTMTVAVVSLGTATALRGLASGPATFALATIAIGVGIAVTQTLVPSVIKAYFANAPGAPTGFFTVCVNVGALAGAALTVPVANMLDSDWRVGLAIWALLAVPAATAWAALARRSEVSFRAPPPAGLPIESRSRLDRGLAARITALMATLSLTFYVPLAWLAATFEDAGLSETSAVTLFSLFIAVQIPTALILPALMRTPRARGRALAAMLAVTAAGLIGAGFAVEVAPAVWAALIGIGVGATFPLGWTLPVDHAPTPARAAQLTAVAFTGGYLIAASGPALAGTLRDATGEMTLPFGILGLLTLAAVPIAWRLARRVNG